ncbi:unnamed protein product [Ilex paraguariensis]|uniref:Uncharacterized protein n=1 Tax=Ilex paraguariensis TaxID=185542 RepID=A0ABC8UI20_9AQUA
MNDFRVSCHCVHVFACGASNSPPTTTNSPSAGPLLFPFPDPDSAFPSHLQINKHSNDIITHFMAKEWKPYVVEEHSIIIFTCVMLWSSSKLGRLLSKQIETSHNPNDTHYPHIFSTLSHSLFPSTPPRPIYD